MFVTIAVAKKPAPSNEERPRNPIFCGEIYDGTEAVTIYSPNFPGYYDDYTTCSWVFENECNIGYDIVPYHFDVEAHPVCSYDKLTFESDGEFNNNITFCNEGNWTGNYYEDLENLFGAMTEPFDVEGGTLEIEFNTDYSVVHTGFKFLVTPIRSSDCDALPRPPASCVESEANPSIAFWKTTADYDKAVPFSLYSNYNVNIRTSERKKECLDECIATAGCFKIKVDNAPLATTPCSLHGNDLAPVAGETFAVNGRTCSEPAERAWLDGRAETRIFCLFGSVDYADSYLESLIRWNGNMTEDWNKSEEGNNISTTRKWTFSVVTNRPSDYGVWYSFYSVTYFRQFLDGRSRRSTDSDSQALFQAIAEQAAQDFVENLDIGDTATVLETEEPVIAVETVEEVADAPNVEFADAFDKIEGIFTNAVEDLRNNASIKGRFGKIKKRFSWFTEYSDAPCAEYAGSGSVDYVAPIVDDEDACASIASFYPALLGYFDNFVCFDRVNKNQFVADIGPKNARRTSRRFTEKKRVFNRILRKLSCSQTL